MTNQPSFEEITLAIVYTVCIIVGIFIIYHMWDSDSFSTVIETLLTMWFGFCCGFMVYELYSVVKGWF